VQWRVDGRRDRHEVGDGIDAAVLGAAGDGDHEGGPIVDQLGNRLGVDAVLVGQRCGEQLDVEQLCGLADAEVDVLAGDDRRICPRRTAAIRRELPGGSHGLDVRFGATACDVPRRLVESGHLAESVDGLGLEFGDRRIGAGISGIGRQEAFGCLPGDRHRLGAHRGEHPVEGLRLGAHIGSISCHDIIRFARG